MLFNSAEYIFLFLPLCILLYYYLKSNTGKIIGLILLSIYFYMVAYPAYILVLFGLIVVDFLAAQIIHKCKGLQRKFWLILALSLNVLLLAGFKYYNFFSQNLGFMGIALPKHAWILPVGLSFHTFQSMSYLIEVYRKSFPVEKNILQYSLYVLFFPQMVAGPIERPQNLIHQFYSLPTFDTENLKQGFFLFARGLFMKVAVADRLTLLVDPVFASSEKATSWQCLTAIVFFSIQIYADFSGYSNMALGSARMLGINLMVNFKQPYLAESLSEFWRKWHISLSTWFRDYLYFPLGGNRSGTGKTIFNILIIFCMSGLWHGAGWNYILWGLLHGIGLSMETVSNRLKFPRIPSWIRLIRTQLWVVFCWVFFRAYNLDSAFGIFKSLFYNGNSAINLEFSSSEILYGFTISFMILISERFQIQEFIFRKFGWAFTLSILVFSYFLGNFNSSTFIYFQF